MQCYFRVLTCRLHQSAEYQAWAAARGRGVQRGSSCFPIRSLIWVLLALAAIAGLWISLPFIQQANLLSQLTSSQEGVWNKLQQRPSSNPVETFEVAAPLPSTGLPEHLHGPGPETAPKVSGSQRERLAQSPSDILQQTTVLERQDLLEQDQVDGTEVAKLRNEVNELLQAAVQMQQALHTQQEEGLRLKEEVLQRDKTVKSLVSQLEDAQDKADAFRKDLATAQAQLQAAVVRKELAAPSGIDAVDPLIGGSSIDSKNLELLPLDSVATDSALSDADEGPATGILPLVSNPVALLLCFISTLLAVRYLRARRAKAKAQAADAEKVKPIAVLLLLLVFTSLQPSKIDFC
jgi:hypothetical protein